jgi:hypothetical protein
MRIHWIEYFSGELKFLIVKDIINGRINEGIMRDPKVNKRPTTEGI